MKLSHRIFLGYFLVVGIAGLFLLKSVRDQLRPAVRQATEETLVETANLLAEIVKNDVLNGTVSTSHFAAAMQNFLVRRFQADIWGLSKDKATYHIYITDDKGIVIYDSENAKLVGENYSRWNDVYLTLRGEYGARSTRSNPKDDSSSVMHIAAPIKNHGEIIGVLTIAKANASLVPFIELSERNIAKAGIVLLLIALIIGWILSTILARSTQKLVDYAKRVKEGKKATLPHISEFELAQLGQAIEAMRNVLEDKEYVERYIHTLTHEIKSPLSGITGATELLLEDMSEKERSHFIHNIKEDTYRIRNIIERLLSLAKLEQQQTLEQNKILYMSSIVEDVLASNSAQLVAKSLKYSISFEESDAVYGDEFLVRQAINNVLDNAIDFSSNADSIVIKGRQDHKKYILTITDNGPGIPDYAKDKIFERFYSLPRLDTGRKSSGLGLSFVKEVMELHQGEVIINSTEMGCEVSLIFPIC